jgi:hypothetical protein
MTRLVEAKPGQIAGATTGRYALPDKRRNNSRIAAPPPTISTVK